MQFIWNCGDVVEKGVTFFAHTAVTSAVDDVASNIVALGLHIDAGNDDQRQPHQSYVDEHVESVDACMYVYSRSLRQRMGLPLASNTLLSRRQPTHAVIHLCAVSPLICVIILWRLLLTVRGNSACHRIMRIQCESKKVSP